MLTWGDYDNDGWLDFYVVPFSVLNQPSVATPHLLYHSNGDGSFTQITEGEIVNTAAFAAGAAWGDYDNDGFPDLFVSTGSQNFLYHNDGNSNRWLTVQCAGTASNRSGIGAKVRVRAKINGQPIWQMREITGGFGANGNGLRAYFGLGDATNIDHVRIEWPSGIVQELQNVNINQLLIVNEPPRLQIVSGQINESLQFDFTGRDGLVYEVQTSSDLSSWTQLAIVTTTNRISRVSDPFATNLAKRFYGVITNGRFSSDGAGGPNQMEPD
jgi:hypothetical protein